MVPWNSDNRAHMSAEPRGVTRRKGSHVHMGKCRSNQIRTCGVPSGGMGTDDSGTADDDQIGSGIERNVAGRGCIHRTVHVL
jgi:hypothetical protein